MTRRSPAVAGMFYPGDAPTLTSMIDEMVDAVALPADDDEPLATAYVVPHAGYRYSGPVAAQVYARLRRHSSSVVRVVIIGPAHRYPLVGCEVTAASTWGTPLGEVAIDQEGARAVSEAGVSMGDLAHAQEHSLEVQVPFLQRVLGDDIMIVPICVGRATPEHVASIIEVAAPVAQGTVILCSTDFSHYLPESEAKVRDSRTAEALMELSPERIGPEDACGVYALRGLLQWAGREPRAQTALLALGTSADTCGDASRVVGYPAFSLRR